MASSPLNRPIENTEQEPLFKWETLKEIGPYTLNYKTPIPGKAYEVQLIGGQTVRVWRGDDCQAYFCHGLTFGGENAPGGPVSPFSGEAVNAIVQHYFARIEPESAAQPGDILVWWGPDDNTPHSAILLEPIVEPEKNCLGYASKVRTKNGIEPVTTMSLEQLITDYYGETYHVYRRK